MTAFTYNSMKLMSMFQILDSGRCYRMGLVPSLYNRFCKFSIQVTMRSKKLKDLSCWLPAWGMHAVIRTEPGLELSQTRSELCSGMDENVLGSSAELFFAPIDVSFADDAPLLPSGFRIIPLDYGKGMFCWMLREIGNCNLLLDMLYNKLQLTFGFDSSLMWMFSSKKKILRPYTFYVAAQKSKLVLLQTCNE
ncbi:hypothetical protein ACFX12_022691 [Malus domestica]